MRVTSPSQSTKPARGQRRCATRVPFSAQRPDAPQAAAPALSKRAAQFLAATLAGLHLSAATLAPAPPPAYAILNSPNAQIARSADAALRRAIPAFNPDVKQVQSKVEDIQFLLRIPQRKPWGNMAKDVREAQGLVGDPSKMLAAVPAGQEDAARRLLDDLTEQLERVQFTIDRKDPDKTATAVAKALATVADLEVLQAPALSFKVPAAYQNLPILTGRAVAELTVEKASGAAAFVDTVNGGVLRQGTVRIVLDGYSAPVSAGNFAALVQAGKLDGKEWGSGYASVVAGRGAAPGSSVPVEILPMGAFEPVYRSPLDVRGGELPVLPLSIRGAVAMGRLPDVDGFLSGEEFFIYKFDPTQAGLAGLSFDEGEFGVFGYVVGGMEEAVAQLDTGDRIVRAKLVSGAERLVNARK